MSKTGAPRKAVLNLNGLRVQQTAARGEKYLPFEITPEDSDEPQAFSVLRRNWWPVKLLISMEDLNADVDILRTVMGKAEFDRLIEAGFDVGDMKVLFKKIMGPADEGDDEGDDEGISLGEASGSSES